MNEFILQNSEMAAITSTRGLNKRNFPSTSAGKQKQKIGLVNNLLGKIATHNKYTSFKNESDGVIRSPLSILVLKMLEDILK